MLYSLFMTEIEYAKTKKNSLINAGTIISSKALQSYLSGLYPSLTIEQWITDEKTNTHSHKLAKNIFEKVCRELCDLVSQFQTNSANSCVPYVGSDSVAISNNQSMNSVNNVSPTVNCQSYNGIHSVDYHRPGL